MNLKKFTRIAVLALSVISIILWFFVATSDSVDEQGRPDGGVMTSPLIFTSLIITFVTVVLTLIYSFKGILSSNNLKKTLTPFALMIGLFILSYIIGNSDPVIKDGVEIVSSGTSKLVSASLNMFYILALAAFGLLLYSSFVRFKK
ncbi:MAG: hypothetical protein KGZ81_09060 [Flavobacteriales bacterium]|nr:hypothetical protein [Flavobacteriales bacterium]